MYICKEYHFLKEFKGHGTPTCRQFNSYGNFTLKLPSLCSLGYCHVHTTACLPTLYASKNCSSHLSTKVILCCKFVLCDARCFLPQLVDQGQECNLNSVIPFWENETQRSRRVSAGMQMDGPVNRVLKLLLWGSHPAAHTSRAQGTLQRGRKKQLCLVEQSEGW